jgi:hypothetical protein
MEKKHLSRREFLRVAGVGGVGLVAAACVPAPASAPVEKVVKETVIVPGTPETIERWSPQPFRQGKTVIEWWHGWPG